MRCLARAAGLVLEAGANGGQLLGFVLSVLSGSSCSRQAAVSNDRSSWPRNGSHFTPLSNGWRVFQVIGCSALLEIPYYRRRRLCKDHANRLELIHHGLPFRFCQARAQGV